MGEKILSFILLGVYCNLFKNDPLFLLMICPLFAREISARGDLLLMARAIFTDSQSVL